MVSLKQISALFVSVVVAAALIYFGISERSEFFKDSVLTNKVYNPIILRKDHENISNHLISDGLPGQPSQVQFNQYAGYITVDELKGRSLFNYFVEAAGVEPFKKPVILWLNGAQDSFVFLLKWFQMVLMYKKNEFYIAGESYAGVFIPELATVILQHNHHAEASFTIRLKGIMIGNGFMNPKTDFRGIYDYMWTHALISDETHHGLIKYCIESSSSKCLLFCGRLGHEMGRTNVYSLYSEYCFPNSSFNNNRAEIDPCDKNYVSAYMNLPEVRKALHANKTQLPYPWSLCSSMIQGWGDRQTNMFPLYRKLISAQLHILVYSGDVDAVVPVTSTRYSINAMKLRIRTSWKPWYDDTQQVAGFRVEYDGLTFMTVLGAGHEVPRYQPRKAFSLLKFFLEGM
ncbi:carboxypeptidase C [Ranunculus cassubicifolius]